MRKQRVTKLYTKKVAKKAVRKQSIKAANETILEYYTRTDGKAPEPAVANAILLEYLSRNTQQFADFRAIVTCMFANKIPARYWKDRDGIYEWFASFAGALPLPSRNFLTAKQLKELSQLTLAEINSILPYNTY